MLIAETIFDEKEHIRQAVVREKPVRSLLKALSWRITGSLDTVLLSWLFTQNMNTALAIGLSEVLTKTLLYYLHERAWNRISIGIG
ncbi:MAG: DUF2061 domain-containing protein [Gammaproteobacteria bacterium]|nr:DUF2061 domain-containing protein [Gammaproteobacteria bacterium]MCZ6668492.1 DUF2061 domain-containing protein [Gammaproteobacteria bacterium]